MRKLQPYLDYGCLEADNNCAERAMKPGMRPVTTAAWGG
jgi:hypothetical protein